MVERSKLGGAGKAPAPARGSSASGPTPPHPGDTAGDTQTADRKAVALRYQPETADSAPVVAASGRGHLAERILEVAREAGVAIHEDADLVELLAASEVGDEIPVEAFIAVAEILRYVYQANGEAPPIPTGGHGK